VQVPSRNSPPPAVSVGRLRAARSRKPANSSAVSWRSTRWLSWRAHRCSSRSALTEGQEVKTEQATYKAAVDQQEASLAKAKATEANAALQLGRGKDLVRSQNIP
jgi:hypothetical protein